MQAVFLVCFLAFPLCGFCEPRASIIKYHSEATEVSAIELLANGRAFDGWFVRVVGVPYIDAEYSLLFATSDHYRAFDTASSIQLLIDDKTMENNLERLEKMTGKHVIVEGIYQFEKRKKLGVGEFHAGVSYLGTISKITKIEVKNSSTP